MDLTAIEALTIGDAWFQCLEKALLEGRTYLIQQGSFEGHSSEGDTSGFNHNSQSRGETIKTRCANWSTGTDHR